MHWLTRLLALNVLDEKAKEHEFVFVEVPLPIVATQTPSLTELLLAKARSLEEAYSGSSVHDRLVITAKVK